jgi:nitrogen fixation protein NifU and related proteins
MYSKEVMKRFTNPKYAGEIKNADAVGQEGNVKCGDIMKIFLKIDDNCKIKDIKFQTYGCMAAIAASDAMCELAKGKTLDQALKIKFSDIVKELKDLPKIKVHCSVLGTKALKNAIENYKKRSKCLKK